MSSLNQNFAITTSSTISINTNIRIINNSNTISSTISINTSSIIR